MSRVAAWRRALVVAGLGGLLLACEPEPPPRGGALPLAPRPDANDCFDAETDLRRVEIDWPRLRNPILRDPDAAVKDVTVRHVGGRWRIAFTSIQERPFRVRVAWSESSSLARLGRITQRWEEPGTGGLASPSLSRLWDGSYATLYNSHARDIGLALPKIYVRTSPDLRRFDPAERMAPAIRGSRIDQVVHPALAHTYEGLLLAFKRYQTLELAHSPSGRIDGPWQHLGAPGIGPFENYQLLTIDGIWHMLATTILHKVPVLHRREPPGWLAWERVRRFDVPEERWNAAVKASGAWLCDARAVDGHYYLFYAGSAETNAFRGRGHSAIGVARSRDLATWEVPPGDAEADGS